MNSSSASMNTSYTSATRSNTPTTPNATNVPAQIALYGCSSINNYEILEKLGEGTFGEVHLARHKPTKEAVALKEIIIHKKDEGMPITALREIHILKGLNHENIIDLLDMAMKRGSRQQRQRSTFYMVTPYMDHDLAGLFQNETAKFTLPHIKCYLQQILHGIGYLHAQNYMHRDVKAANILIDNRGRVKIADFGLARKYMEDPPTISGTSSATHRYTPTVVTRWYRPPELLMGEQKYTTAIDMWGVGCVFGEFFRRKPILPGKSDENQLVITVQLVGSPTAETMPGYDRLPGASLLPPNHFEPTIDTVFGDVPIQARDLLRGLLALDPLRRLSAEGALAHEFFTTDPPAADPRDLPTYNSSHELDSRKRREHEHMQHNREHNHAGLPSRPSFGNHDRRNPVTNSANGVGKERRRKLGFKLRDRPILQGIDLIPPYRRNRQMNREDTAKSVPNHGSTTQENGGLDY